MNNYTDTAVDIWRQACAAALAGLPGLGPARLAALLADATPEETWARLAEAKELPPSVRPLCGSESQAKKLLASWNKSMQRTDPLDVLERYHSHDISVWTLLDDYPVRLLDDPVAPAVLFWQGRPAALAAPTVAIIGTRHCTPEGRTIARRFGAELTEAGVSVVSGLALGIDGAAHRGALEASGGAPPIAVVGNGLDTVYPLRHKDLWAGIRESGLIVTEAPVGSTPEPWRFPARNRIIAGLADLVVVVESHDQGGSLLTVRDAQDRSVEVMAVPGSIHSPASRGTNMLIRDGAGPVCSTEDILFALFSSTMERPEPIAEPPDPEVEDVDVLNAVGWSPTSTDEVLLRTGLSLGQVAASLHRLEQIGWVANEAGWWQRCER